MKQFLSTKYSDTAISFSLLVLRLAMGLLMIPHGYGKLVKFGSRASEFGDPIGLGSPLSMGLTIFAEFFCALFVVLGLFTRFAVIPLMIVMLVAVFKIHNGDFFGDAQTATLFLAGYIALVLSGPGRFSLDRVLGK